MTATDRLEIAHLMIKEAGKWDRLLTQGELRGKDVARLRGGSGMIQQSRNLFRDADARQMGELVGSLAQYPTKDPYSAASKLKELRQLLRHPSDSNAHFDARRTVDEGPLAALKTKILQRRV